MKALITGAGGFVGGYLKKHLEESNIEVAGLDKNPNDNTTHTVDILDKEKLTEIIKEVAPDLIFHLAAQSSVKKSWQEPELTKEINVQGTKNLLDAVQDNNLKPKILLISSADVYGIPEKLPMDEELPLKPVSPYGKSRIEQEQLALSYDLDIIISRSFTHTGPGQKPIFVCSDFVKQVAEIEKGKKTELVTGDLTITRDIIDVRDMVNAYLIAIQKAEPKQIYNLCGNKGYKLQDIVDILKTLTETEITVKQDPEKIRKKDIPEMIGDNTKFTQATNWKPKIPMQQTLKDMLDFWRKEL